MPDLQRPIKTAGTRRFQDEYALGQQYAKDVELDMDLDTIYNAWNTEIPPAMLLVGITGPAGGDLEGEYPNPRVRQCSADDGFWIPSTGGVNIGVTLQRTRLQGSSGAGIFSFNQKAETMAQDDAAKPSWLVQLANTGVADAVSFYRTPPGGAAVQLAKLAGDGTFFWGPRLEKGRLFASAAGGEDIYVGLAINFKDLSAQDNPLIPTWFTTLRCDAAESFAVSRVGAGGGLPTELFKVLPSGRALVAADPVNPLEVATKQYVDGVVLAGSPSPTIASGNIVTSLNVLVATTETTIATTSSLTTTGRPVIITSASGVYVTQGNNPHTSEFTWRFYRDTTLIKSVVTQITNQNANYVTVPLAIGTIVDAGAAAGAHTWSVKLIGNNVGPVIGTKAANAGVVQAWEL